MTGKLPTTTTERLLAVADQIERHPESYDQSEWGFWGLNDPEASPTCGTPACICGWAARFTPKAQRDEVASMGFDGIGATLLGFDYGLAAHLFTSSQSFDIATRGQMPDLLRSLATVPESERTLDNATGLGWLD